MGGSDGKLRMWEPNIKKLITDFSGYPNEIAAVDTSETGIRNFFAFQKKYYFTFDH